MIICFFFFNMYMQDSTAREYHVKTNLLLFTKLYFNHRKQPGTKLHQSNNGSMPTNKDRQIDRDWELEKVLYGQEFKEVASLFMLIRKHKEMYRTDMFLVMEFYSK